MGNRPRSWNDDVRWLLERIAGLPGSAGPGTDPADLPQGIGVSDVIQYIAGTHTAIDSTGEITLQLPLTTRQWNLAAFSYIQDSGTANRIEVRLGQAAAFADDGVDERVHIQQQNSNTKVDIVFQYPVPFYVDADGRAYLRPGYNAGADNVGSYRFWFIQGHEVA